MKRTFLFLVLVLCQSILAGTAFSEPPKLKLKQSARLLSLEKAQPSEKFSNYKLSSYSIEQTSIEDILRNKDKYQDFRIQQRAQDQIEEYVSDEDAKRRLAQSLLSYHSFFSLIDYIRRSPSAQTFSNLAREVKTVKDETTVTVPKDNDFSPKFSDNKLVEFNLRLNTRNAIEPRIEIGSDFEVSYDLGDKAALFSFSQDF